MPIFLGAISHRADSEFFAKLNLDFIRILNSNSSKELIKIKTDSCLVSIKLKDYEATHDQVIALPQNEGVIIGRLYSNHSNSISIIKQNYKAIQESNGQWLSQNCWGNYVCIIINSNTNLISVYRDPMGLSQIYFIKIKDIIFFSSDLHLLVEAIGDKYDKLSIDWNYFATYLSCGLLNTSKTPFREVNELLPGCCLNFDAQDIKPKIFPFWDPTKIQLKSTNYDDGLISTINSSVNKLIAETPRLCLEFSGGLDSTALLMSIMHSLKDKQKCYFANYLNEEVASSNESIHAKNITDDFDLDLITNEIQFSPFPSKVEKWNRPYQDILWLNSKLSLLERCNNNIEFISGHGGDHLFLATADSTFLIDYLLHNGFNGFLDKLKQASLINRNSAFPILLNALKNLYRYIFKIKHKKHVVFPIRKKDWFTMELEKLVNPQIYRPPFWRNLSKVHPGKALHILQMYHATAHTGFESPGVVKIYPFLSQPIVEYGLSIPTYESFNKDWSRFHFRRAISNYFETKHVWRQSKGELTGVIQMCFSKHLTRIQELCLEGKFSQQNLIHKDLFKKHLYLLANGRMDEQSLATRLLLSELWFEAWGIK